MIIKKYKSLVTSIKNPVAGIYTLELKTLNGPYKYAPGQFLHLALDTEYDGTGQWPESRCFSMQSNPDEETIRITYAVKGRFTKMMEQQIEVGLEFWLKLPYGDLFTRPHNKVNTVFIAGGTGITPFLSLFTYKSFNEYINPRIYLGFRSEGYNIYKNELNFEILNSPLVELSTAEIFYEDIEGKPNIHKIFEKNGSNPDYFISGPPDMIKAFKYQLIADSVSMDHIKTDDWE